MQVWGYNYNWYEKISINFWLIFLNQNLISITGSNFTKKLVYNMDSSIYSGYQHAHPGFIVMGTDQRFIGIHIDVGGSPIEIEAMPGGKASL